MLLYFPNKHWHTYKRYEILHIIRFTLVLIDLKMIPHSLCCRQENISMNLSISTINRKASLQMNHSALVMVLNSQMCNSASCFARGGILNTEALFFILFYFFSPKAAFLSHPFSRHLPCWVDADCSVTGAQVVFWIRPSHSEASSLVKLALG